MQIIDIYINTEVVHHTKYSLLFKLHKCASSRLKLKCYTGSYYSREEKSEVRPDIIVNMPASHRFSVQIF